MIVGTAGLKLVAMRDEGIGKSTRVSDDLLGVQLELRLRNLEEGSSDSGDGLKQR